MESFEQEPGFNVQAALEQVPGVSEVQAVELDEEYFAWARENLSPEVYENIKTNYESLDARRYRYLSDGLSINGYIWTPKEMNQQLPLVVWNRGGTREYGSIGERQGTAYADIPCDLARQGAVVVASEYRGGLGCEGEDEWGGDDLRDVVRVKEIADQLPFCTPGEAIVAGASRGGMMSYLLAAREPWVKAVISLAGTADLITSAQDDPDMKRIYEECFGGSEEEMKKRSATHFYPDIPKELPILMMHGLQDDRVSVEQARKLHELLRVSGHNVEYHEFPGAGHTFYSAESPQRKEAMEIMQRFLREQL